VISDLVFERFFEERPVSAIVHELLETILIPQTQKLNELFEQNTTTQLFL
jgi:hypothetical protein